MFITSEQSDLKRSQSPSGQRRTALKSIKAWNGVIHDIISVIIIVNVIGVSVMVTAWLLSKCLSGLLVYLAAQRSRRCLPHEETVHRQSHRQQPSWHCAGGHPPGSELLHPLSSGWRAPPGALGVGHHGSPGSLATACMCREQL